MPYRICLMVLATLLFFSAPACSQVTAPQGGTIHVTCAQETALVFVDHVMVGKVPINVTVAPGQHEVRVSAGEDYVPFVQEVAVSSGMTSSVVAILTRTSSSLYRDAMHALKERRFEEAGQLLGQAAQAPGKRAAEIPFYQGLLAERARDLPAAERFYVSWLNVNQDSASGQYRLGRVRQSLGQASLAATAYKAAILCGVSGAARLFSSAGQPTSANIARLEALARMPGPDSLGATLQLAHLLELKGNVAGARDCYRSFFESLAASRHVALDNPTPAGVPIALPEPGSMRNPPAPPANTMYVTADSAAPVAAAWRACARAMPALAGSAMIGTPSNRWIALQARAFDSAGQDTIDRACQSLSASLRTDVLFLQITPDGRSWYFYWNSGRLRDRYCSNPGRPGEVDYKTLRAWSGKPEILVEICRGKPLSSRRPAPSITDLNAILYFYYPELRETRPGSWRTPATFMKTLASIVGLPCEPSRFGDRAARGGSFQPL